MKTLFLAFIFLYNFSLAQSQWTNQNFGGGRDVFFIDDSTGWISYEGPIQFIDQNTGWICGGGDIKKTTNGGIDWIHNPGETGKITKTTNGGESWFTLTTGTTEQLNEIHFCNLNIGYAVGNNELILKTTDGGLTWIKQKIGSSYDLYSVDFVDTLVGYAVGGRDSIKFLKTTDGGINWIEKNITIGYTETPILNCVEFIDANTGYIGSEGAFLNHSGKICKTTDGGDSWNSQIMARPLGEENTPNKEHESDLLVDGLRGIRSIYFKDANNGYAVGGTSDGWWRRIFTTTDAGDTWQTKYASPEQTGLLSVYVSGSGKGWALGYAGVTYITEDSGASWSQILSGSQGSWTGDWITSVFMVNDSVGWAAGFRKGYKYYKIILKTTNGGKIWKTNFQFDQTAEKTEANIFFINENIGWASYRNRISYKTTNGGNSWFRSGIGATEQFFINQDTGWATHTTEGVYKSTNGGTEWVQKSSVRSRSIYFSEINNGWVVGEGGSILKSTDAGESWIPKTSGTSSNINSVRFYNNNVGICAGNSGTVLLSTNSGENWTSQSAGTFAALNSVAFTNSTTAWIAGSGGTMLNTTDLGYSWISYSGLEGNLAALHFINENMGWVCGDNNIYKYSTQPLLTLSTPNGGEIWKTGLTKNITWSSENVQYVNLYYSYNNGTNWNIIDSNVAASNGSYAWEIPILDSSISLHCKVKIESASNLNVFNVSENTFVIWNLCNIVQYANFGQQMIDFLETNIDISLNVAASDSISVTYYPYETPVEGTLPAGIVVVSDYFWKVSAPGISFNSGKIIIPISTLRGVTDASKLVWLKRTNSGEPWENIGGIISTDNLESTVIFNSFSEFAIGSNDLVNPLPVELSSFTATNITNQIIIKWETKTESNNSGFEIQKSSDRINFNNIAFLPGFGTTTEPRNYSFIDNSLNSGKYYYRLKQIDYNGEFDYSDIIEVEVNAPIAFALYQNYPNPFNPTTKIRYQLPKESKVVIKIYNILGSEVMELVNEQKEPGIYEVEFSAMDGVSNLSSGTYVYKISASGFEQTRKMLLLK